MSDSISKTQRWLDLIAFLVGRRLPVTAEEIMEAVPDYARQWSSGERRDRDSARRKFERDKDELRRLGFPLETVPYSINYGLEQVEGYRLRDRDFYLPYLRLLEESTGAGPAPRAAERTRVSQGPREPGPAGPTARARRDVGGVAEESPRLAYEAPVSRSFALPSFDIRPEEVRAASRALRRVADLPSFPFRREARSAFRKLLFDLDPSGLTGDGATGVLYLDPPGAPDVRETVRRLSDALAARKRVRFRYHGIYRGESTERDVAGYGLLFHHGHWYLVGHDALRNDMRVFRVGRMADVRPNARSANTPDYEVPADFDLRSYTGLQPWELSGEVEEPLRARVRFRFPASLWAARNGYGSLEKQLQGGAAVRSFDVHQVNPFLRWLLSLEGEAQVLDPPELRDELRAMALRVVARHGGDMPGAPEEPRG